LIDHFFTEILGLTPETALKTTKAIDARAKIGEPAYEKWLGELGIGAEQREKMERFFKSSFEEVASQFPCRGVTELQSLFHYLKESGLNVGDSEVIFDPSVLRGMDYYTGTVFEMYDTSPENRRAMFGGGRYDNLIGLFGNHKLSGVGFGMGDVTFRHFLETHKLLPDFGSDIDVLVTLPKLELRAVAEKIAKSLRSVRSAQSAQSARTQGAGQNLRPSLRVMTPLSVEGFGAQLKLAAKHKARYVVLLGDTELAEGKVVLKNLVKGEQETVLISALAEHVSSLVGTEQ
jgi:histidyl-tRNA synthetase